MTTSIQQTNNNQTVGFPHTPTAHQKANVSEMRMKPNDYVLFRSNEALGIEVYVNPTGLVALGFQGKKVKASFHYKFTSQESLKNHVDSFVNGLEKTAEDKAKFKAERAQPRALNVGDVLVSSWGYEQTNIDYFQVVGLVGKSSVMLQEIAKDKTTDSRGDTGKCVPVLDKFIGEPFTKKVVHGVRVTLTSYSSASKKEFTLVDGVKTFKPDFWSSYA